MMNISKRTGALFITLFVIFLIFIKLRWPESFSKNTPIQPIRLKEIIVKHQAETADADGKGNYNRNDKSFLRDENTKVSSESGEHVTTRRLWSVKNVDQLWQELGVPENV